MKSKNNVQLFLLHFAGGNIYSLQFLKPYLPISFDFHALELPGRGKRMSKSLLTNEVDAVNDLVDQITSLRNGQPFLIFGHSMGASLGLRVTKKLEELGDTPKGLIVAGNAGPGTGDGKRRAQMNDDDLKEELRRLGGIKDEVLDNEELFNFFAPIMRSDFEILENSKTLAPGFKINAPITAVMGDEELTASKIENWRNFTSAEFKFHLLSGNHFFINDHAFNLMKIIKHSYDRPLVL